MSASHAPAFDLPPWRLVVGGWTAVGLFRYSGFYVSARFGLLGAPWSEVWASILFASVIKTGVWIAYTPWIVRLARRHPVRWRLRPLGLHLGAAVGLALPSVALSWAVGRVLYTADYPFVDYAVGVGHVELLFYALVVGADGVLGHYRNAREREARAARLEAELREARFEAVRLRLDPDLVVASLDALAGLVPRAPEQADDLIASLGDLIRSRMRTGTDERVPLGEEVELVETYLELRRAVAGGGLRLDLRVDDDAWEARLPGQTLLALVEAVLGGVTERAPRSVAVRVEIAGGGLAMEVRASPADERPAPVPSGLAPLEQRLAGRSSQAGRLSRVPGGLRLALPAETAPSPGLAPAGEVRA